jgi:hypothetical protein
MTGSSASFCQEDVEHVSVGLNHIQCVRRSDSLVIGTIESFAAG